MQAMLVLVERILHNIIRFTGNQKSLFLSPLLPAAILQHHSSGSGLSNVILKVKEKFFAFLLFALSYQNKTTTWVLQVKETFFAFLLFVLSYQNNSVEDDATKYLLCFLALCTELLQMAGICRIKTTPSGGIFKQLNLPSMLPPYLVKLPHLRHVDFALNYLSGTIPKEWGSTKLTNISLFVNRISGEIPKELGSITTLTYFAFILLSHWTSLCSPPFFPFFFSDLKSGTLKQTNFLVLFPMNLILSSNKLSGKLRVTFAKFQNLTDFRISDNSFNGEIPSFIQNWKLLQRLEMHASGLEGPTPSNISLLSNLNQLRIGDINGPSQDFPMLRNMTGMAILVLRNCHITGELPIYFWSMKDLNMLDASFNKLVGEIPVAAHVGHLRFLFLTGNMLSGNVPEPVLMDGSSVDLSYNNFMWQEPDQPACRDDLSECKVFHNNYS
ncbi:putative LRR receptor-like serine/threonine-protein kinase RFK1 [Glycine soja]|uniref:Putative LRR receptor-like serine/threonine-protein kinase RFK1 n=1 Tax=Glycine soja TaxID=3848 RepID=A0A445JDG6_GLYSO|nr:putative LRR receptor-like serine/threonine-protein kinase RFK1 [Glycine soja]